MTTIADYIVDFLKNVGVRQVFGYPGTPILPLMAALERQSDIEWVLLRYENSAAMAASAQARLTGELAVCMATSGPGRVDVLPQDMGRVLLNLYNNAFYAVRQKQRDLSNVDSSADAPYQPIVSVQTRRENNQVILSVQ